MDRSHLAWTRLPIVSALGTLSIALWMTVASPTAYADTAVACDKVAATDGSDTAAGTLDSPYRTTQMLVDSLSAGQMGCLRAGTYRETSIKVSRGGVKGARVIIRSYPGERATLIGNLWVTDDADYVTVSYLNLVGDGAPTGPEVNGDHVTFTKDDVTNHHTAICFHAGTVKYGRARRLKITRNRIHDCGRLPATNYDHGVYLGRTDYARITDNMIYDNADRGIQLYPDAQHTYVANNVIDGNGTAIRISGAYGVASNDNLVEHNLITNSRAYNLDSWYPSGNPIGTGNMVHDNCVWNGGRPNASDSQIGYGLASNLNVDPLYVDRAANDFRLAATSPCLSLTADIAASLDGLSSADAGTAQSAP